MDKYFNLYIETNLNVADVIVFLNSIIKDSRINGIYTLSTKYYDFEVMLNKEYNIYLNKKFPDGFLYFKHIIECYPNVGEFDDKEYISFVNKVLKDLWNKDVPAIVACDFEEDLINNGGYKSLEVPFPPDGASEIT